MNINLSQRLQNVFSLIGLDWIRVSSFWRYVWRQFGRDQCLTSAGMLTYTTLLSLVPLTTVILSIASAFPVFDRLSEQARQFIFQNFVPAARETVETYLFEFAGQASQLTAAMSVILIVTALLLMSSIESTFNRIWGVARPRTLVNRFVVYWSALSMGPILLGVSIALSSYFFSLSVFTEIEGASGVRRVLQSSLPFVVGAVAFFLMFLIVPNRNVPWRHAAYGGLLTALMFETAKQGFAVYVSNFDGYQRIYGALSAIPIFLIWIYLTWSVILLGASFTASLGSFRYRGGKRSWPREREFVLLYRLVGHLWNAQKTGLGISSQGMLALEPGVEDHQLQGLLELLRQRSFVTRDESERWALIRDLDEVTLGELYHSGEFTLPLRSRPWLPAQPDGWDQALSEAFETLDDSAQAAFDQSLKSLYLAHAQDDAQATGPVRTLRAQP